MCISKHFYYIQIRKRLSRQRQKERKIRILTSFDLNLSFFFCLLQHYLSKVLLISRCFRLIDNALDLSEIVKNVKALEHRIPVLKLYKC